MWSDIERDLKRGGSLCFAGGPGESVYRIGA